MEEEEYKIVSVRLTKEQWAYLMDHVNEERGYQKNYRISDLLRAMVAEWIQDN